jgi:hypothetical protein
MLDARTERERQAFEAWTPMAPPPSFADRVIAKRFPNRRARPIAIAAAGVCTLAATVAAVLHFMPGPAERAALAELVDAHGPVDRQAGDATWRAAPLHTQFFAGDAVRTADGSAELGVIGARIVVEPHTILRFGTNLTVEVGEVELRGSGTFGFAFGEIRLASAGAVKITPRSVELVIGSAQVATSDGAPLDLALGRTFDIGLGRVAIATIDAGLPVIGELSIDVTGKGVEMQPPGGSSFFALPAGITTVPAGSALRIASGGAKLTGTGTLSLPGGAIELRDAAELHLAGAPHGTKLSVAQGAAKLVGKDAELELARGESAMLADSGAITVLDVIPRYFDMVAADAAFVVHDPKGATAIQFRFDKCAHGGSVELDRDNRFRTPRTSAGTDAANILVPAGSWAYRVRCTNGTTPTRGLVTVLRDAGRRPLPALLARNTIDLDGRTYTVSYQSMIPTIVMRVPGGGHAVRVHLATGGQDEIFESTSPTVTVPSAKLREALYTVWAEVDGAKSKVTTLKINFDQTAAQVYLESPIDGRPWPADIDIRGAVLPGWTASLEGVAIPIDAQRRFVAKVSHPAGKALAIKMAHPVRGVHYYLRRE